MQASIESTGNLERRLTFSLPEDRLQTHISGRLGEIARTTRIKGFRPGKVPAKVIEQLRVEAARGRIEESAEPLEAIARSVGFSDPERMRRAFIRVFGLSPQAIRRLGRAG